MTRETILHVGMPKTGSTAIQNVFEGHDGEGALFPSLPGFRNHTEAVLGKFSKRAHRYFANKRMNKGMDAPIPDRLDCKRALRRAEQKAGDRTLILSGESLAVHLEEPDLVKFAKWNEARNRRVRILAYVRAPIAATSSNLSQSLKSLPATELPIRTPRYAQMEKFARVFGKDQLELVPYDVADFPQGDVVRDFAERLDLPEPPVRKTRVNASPSAPVLGMMLALNRQFPDEDREVVNLAKRAIARHCEIPDGEPAIVASGRVKEELSDADVRWLERNMPADFLDETLSGEIVADTADLLGCDPGWHQGIERAVVATRKDERVNELLVEFATSRRS